MDKFLYVAMSGAAEAMRAQTLHAHNLANVSTTSFKADLQQMRSMPVYGDSLPSRVYAAAEQPGYNLQPGAIRTTGNDLDIALTTAGWLQVETATGQQGLSRRGDLSVNEQGFLVNGSGHFILSNAGTRISVPDAQKIEIGSNGAINVIPLNADPGTKVLVATLSLVNPEANNLTKDQSGLFVLKDKTEPVQDINVKVKTGIIEESNVQTVSEMMGLISLARQYELDVKMMKTAEENDQATTRLMHIT